MADNISRDPEPLGGADSVQKTTYVVGEGTDPNRTHPIDIPAARVSATEGRNPMMWIGIGLVAIGAAAYLIALLA